jgi:LmbE family N-acetylglucosaminyl deacetylase
MVKYKQEGKRVKTVVFSYGESSHPHLKADYVRKERAKEAYASDKILGSDGIIFLGLKEGKFLSIKQQLEARKKLKEILKKEKPGKIFTHSLDDPHPDHRAVRNVVLDLVKVLKYKGEVYSFNVWNPLNFRKRDSPKLFIDVSDSFGKKIEAFWAHRSQTGAIISLLWNVYFQAIVNGWKNKCRYAEVFYKIQ